MTWLPIPSMKCLITVMSQKLQDSWLSTVLVDDLLLTSLDLVRLSRFQVPLPKNNFSAVLCFVRIPGVVLEASGGVQNPQPPPRGLATDYRGIRDSNPGHIFSIPGFGIETFLMPGSRRNNVTTHDHYNATTCES
jgi:hypothetical protein